MKCRVDSLNYFGTEVVLIYGLDGEGGHTNIRMLRFLLFLLSFFYCVQLLYVPKVRCRHYIHISLYSSAHLCITDRIYPWDVKVQSYFLLKMHVGFDYSIYTLWIHENINNTECKPR